MKAEHLPVRGSNGNVLPTFLPCYEGITEDKAIGTSSWLPFANSIFGSKASGWEILMPAAGLMTWFTRPYPTRLRHFQCDGPVPPFPALKPTSGSVPIRRCRKYQVVMIGVSLSPGISLNGSARRGSKLP